MWVKRAWMIPTVLVVGLCAALFFRGESEVSENFPVLAPEEIGPEPKPAAGGTELATFGSGCFWCSEAVFRQMKGVRSAVSGYSGGHVKNPTYKQVCGGATGHAEVVQVTFDPAEVSYPELLEVFWRSHDPTTRDRQGNDVGTQYRSVIFYHTERQKQLAERYKQKIEAAGVFRSPLVTEIVPFAEFHPAEAEHQNFFAENPRQPYCRAIIHPKLDKMRKVFKDRIKPG